MSLKLLIVKTSSMGDVVHALPVINDIHRYHAGSQVDWLVEAPYAAIPLMHPGVRRVLNLQWRKWRRTLFERSTWRAMGALRDELQQGGYDRVLDLQGLLKSALWARQTGAAVVGYDSASAREPLAAWLYRDTAAVARNLQAVLRCRALAAAHLHHTLPTSAPDFGIRAPAATWAPRDGDYAVLIPNASRASKHWPERHWVALGNRLLERGMTPVVLWGARDEQSLAENIAAGCAGDVPPLLKVGEMAAVLAGARQVVGLDTGFTHLAAALGRPTLGIYCDHDPGLAGITGPGRVASIGGKGQVPSRGDVLALLEVQMAR